jgi:hypothetical protein
MFCGDIEWKIVVLRMTASKSRRVESCKRADASIGHGVAKSNRKKNKR